MKLHRLMLSAIIFFSILAIAASAASSSSSNIMKGDFVLVPGKAPASPIVTQSVDLDILDDDITPPQVVFDLPGHWESSCSGSPSLSISGSASDDVDIVSVRWENQAGQTGTCTGLSSWKSTNVVLEEGDNLICVTAEDSAGNVGSASVFVSYNPNGPTVNITDPTDQSTYTSPIALDKITISGTSTGDREVTKVCWSTLQGASGDCVGTGKWTATDVPLSVGNNTIIITATDSQGEFGSKSINVVIPDLVKPEVAIVSPTMALASRRIGASVPVSGLASDNGTLKSVSWETDTGFSGTCNGTTNWSIAQLPLAIGENKLTITAIDDCDNSSTAEIVITRQQTTVASSWLGLTMAALPMVPDITDPKTGLNFYGNCWASFNTQLNMYHNYPDLATWLSPADRTPGRGFWGAFTIGVGDPLGYATSLDTEVPIALHPGWNLIGNPYNAAIDWDPTKIKIKLMGSDQWISMSESTDDIRDYAIGWQQNPADPLKGAYYPIANEVVEGVVNFLEPWRAFWIKSFADCEILFPVPQPGPARSSGS